MVASRIVVSGGVTIAGQTAPGGGITIYMQQVAIMYGYRNKLANFSKDFRKVHGVAPRELTRKNNCAVTEEHAQLQEA
jgi:hypothetical protein